MRISQKSLLLGFGLGVLFTTLLGIVVVRASIKNANEAVRVSDQEVIERAKILGLVDPNEFMKIEDPQNNTIPQEPLQQPEEPNQIQNAEQTQLEDINIQINYQDTSISIAQQLEQKGLIEDAVAFNTLAMDKKLTTKMRTGKYVIRQGTSMEEILRVITTPPPFKK